MDQNTANSNNNQSRNASASKNATLHKIKVLKAMKSIGEAQTPSVLVFLNCMYHAIDGHRRLSSDAGRIHGDVSPRNIFHVAEVNGSPGFGVLSDFDSPPKRSPGWKEPESCAKEAASAQGNNAMGGSTSVLPVD